ncbi:MAG: hypothetical protein QF805_16150 [Pirellulaceae bacterium]|jgi:hypothetical protein|nr:hypothetical protein [Pirellulaceae bacterium]
MTRNRIVPFLALFTIVSVSAALVSARKPRERTTTASVKIPKDSPTVDLFAGMKAGELEVTFIPKDSKGANVLIKNKTGKPVRVALPGAFAGVPAMAQFGGGGMGGMGGMGGGMGGMGGGGGGGFFNVAPDRVAKIPVKTVCLEHGKPDPTARMKYTIAPIETLSKRADVRELCKMLARGEITQNTAQAASWHLQNGLSWIELARKDRVRLRNGYTEKYFSPRELHFAMRATQFAVQRAEATQQNSPGKQDSLSNQQIGE